MNETHLSETNFKNSALMAEQNEQDGRILEPGRSDDMLLQQFAGEIV